LTADVRGLDVTPSPADRLATETRPARDRPAADRDRGPPRGRHPAGASRQVVSQEPPAPLPLPRCRRRAEMPQPGDSDRVEMVPPVRCLSFGRSSRSSSNAPCRA
jgi:hypothetical protein